jgi:hypothetical protein
MPEPPRLERLSGADRKPRPLGAAADKGCPFEARFSGLDSNGVRLSRHEQSTRPGERVETAGGQGLRRTSSAQRASACCHDGISIPNVSRIFSFASRLLSGRRAAAGYCEVAKGAILGRLAGLYSSKIAWAKSNPLAPPLLHLCSLGSRPRLFYARRERPTQPSLPVLPERAVRAANLAGTRARRNFGRSFVAGLASAPMSACIMARS